MPFSVLWFGTVDCVLQVVEFPKIAGIRISIFLCLLVEKIEKFNENEGAGIRY